VINDHGVDLRDIEDVFSDSYGLYLEDFEHSTESETRFNVIGMTSRYGLVFAAYVYANENDIRLITARRAENWMVKEYEKQRKRF
jgi:uncharacterized DUF497 family protein